MGRTDRDHRRLPDRCGHRDHPVPVGAPVTERQLRVALITGGTLLAIYLATVLFAWCGLLPAQPVTNLQLPTT